MSDEIKGLLLQTNKLIEQNRKAYDEALEKNEQNSAELKEKQDKMYNEFESVSKRLEEAEKNQAALKGQFELLESMQSNSGFNREENARKAKEKELNALLDFTRNAEDGKANFHGVARQLNLISTDSNPDGGFASYPQLEGLKKGRFFETSDIRAVATVKSTSRDRIKVEIDDDEAEATRTDQRSAASDTDTPQVQELFIDIHKYDAEPGITHEAIQDAYFDMESWVNAKVFDRISRLQNTDFVTGSGVKGARGFLSYDAAADADTYEYGKIGQLTSSISGDFTADDLIKLMGLIKSPYMNANTKMGMNRRTFFNKLLLKKNGFGDYLFLENLKDSMSGMKFLGVDIKIWDDMPEVSAGNLAIALGDFKQCYTILDKPGMNVIRDIYTDKSKVKLYTAVRTGGGVENFDGIKLLKMKA